LRRRNQRATTIPPLPPLILIWWKDAAIDLAHTARLDRPHELKAFGGAAMCVDAGFLIREDKENVVIGVGLSLEEGKAWEARHSNTIPKALEIYRKVIS
jgi:hypothetical protein